MIFAYIMSMENNSTSFDTERKQLSTKVFEEKKDADKCKNSRLFLNISKRHRDHVEASDRRIKKALRS